MRTQRQMHAFVEVVTGLPVTTLDIFCHLGFQEVPRLVEKDLIVVGKHDA